MAKKKKKKWTMTDAYLSVRKTWEGIARPVTKVKGDARKEKDRRKCRDKKPPDGTE